MLIYNHNIFLPAFFFILSLCVSDTYIILSFVSFALLKLQSTGISVARLYLRVSASVCEYVCLFYARFMQKLTHAVDSLPSFKTCRSVSTSSLSVYTHSHTHTHTHTQMHAHTMFTQHYRQDAVIHSLRTQGKRATEAIRPKHTHLHTPTVCRTLLDKNYQR